MNWLMIITNFVFPLIAIIVLAWRVMYLQGRLQEHEKRESKIKLNSGEFISMIERTNHEQERPSTV